MPVAAVPETVGTVARKGDFVAIRVDSSYTMVGGAMVLSTRYYLRIVARADKNGRVSEVRGPNGLTKGPLNCPLFIAERARLNGAELEAAVLGGAAGEFATLHELKAFVLQYKKGA